jgi:hypothetical protein
LGGEFKVHLDFKSEFIDEEKEKEGWNWWKKEIKNKKKELRN